MPERAHTHVHTQTLPFPLIRTDGTLDNQGKTPLHHFIVEWSEDRFARILDTLLDLQPSSCESNDTGSDSSTNVVDVLPTLADCDGRTILDYAC